ncbi:MAG: hypothetical protein Q8S09_05610, partial [Hyphomonas sp.]|nr:hypothetical protein [Hyphomonas sp.]
MATPSMDAVRQALAVAASRTRIVSFPGICRQSEGRGKLVSDKGLLRTGDRVRLGEDGYLHSADRAKHMLKVGGENDAASEIERAILTVPGVPEGAVVGVRRNMFEEMPVAFVILQAGKAEALIGVMEAACAVSRAP